MSGLAFEEIELILKIGKALGGINCLSGKLKKIRNDTIAGNPPITTLWTEIDTCDDAHRALTAAVECLEAIGGAPSKDFLFDPDALEELAKSIRDQQREDAADLAYTDSRERIATLSRTDAKPAAA